MRVLKFVCPKCGHPVLEQVIDDASTYTPITALREGGDHSYGTTVIEMNDCAECNYRCAKCGQVLKDEWYEPVNDLDGLEKWLLQQTVNIKRGNRRGKYA